jgi:hypothetical protein
VQLMACEQGDVSSDRLVETGEVTAQNCFRIVGDLVVLLLVVAHLFFVHG